MNKTTVLTTHLKQPEQKTHYQSPVTAHIAPSKNTGVIMVTFNGNPPTPARLISGINRHKLHPGSEVLVVFDGGDPEKPVITGIMESLLDDLVTVDPTQIPTEADVDDKRVVFEADEEIVLKCGKGSITLTKDGKIVLKGTQLVSRASGTNKIKGSSVQLN